jgi:hypothetical protein
MRKRSSASHRSIVVSALLGFVVAAEIDPDEPSAVASCDDLANCASHSDFLRARKRDTRPAHPDRESRHSSVG